MLKLTNNTLTERGRVTYTMDSRHLTELLNNAAREAFDFYEDDTLQQFTFYDDAQTLSVLQVAQNRTWLAILRARHSLFVIINHH
jgi:hypothetical protein